MIQKKKYTGPEIRLDQYLVQQFSNMSRSYLQQMIEKGHVLVNQKVGKKGSILQNGDIIDVQPFVHPNERTIEGNPGAHFAIIKEFENYIVLDKPPFLPTHPNQFEDKNTVANGLVAKFPSVIGVGEDPLRPGIVHRLDSNTSGVMLAALTQSGFMELRSLFNQRKIHKTYVALVLGDIQKAGTVETDIAHHLKNIRRMVAITSDKVEFRSRRRPAKTLYEPMERFGDYTLVRVQTLTGRMHQVRVHLSSIGHPLVGDKLYQSDREKNQDKLGLTRHFLHAVSIEFKDPWTGQEQRFDSPLSQDLDFVLADLRT